MLTSEGLPQVATIFALPKGRYVAYDDQIKASHKAQAPTLFLPLFLGLPSFLDPPSSFIPLLTLPLDFDLILSPLLVPSGPSVDVAVAVAVFLFLLVPSPARTGGSNFFGPSEPCSRTSIPVYRNSVSVSSWGNHALSIIRSRRAGSTLSGRMSSSGNGPMYQYVKGTWGNLAGRGGGLLGNLRGLTRI